jgi:chorismate synthase
MTIRFLTAGESHGAALVAILEGFPAGFPISNVFIDQELSRRQRGYGAGPRMRIERDHAVILSGVLEGISTGAPIAVTIDNRDHEKWKGIAVEPFTTPRPGHADLTGAIKYGYNDLRPALERASARETAARVALGAICKQLLAQFDIQVGGYVTSIGKITADIDEIPGIERFSQAEASPVRCPEPVAAAAMQAHIREIMEARDTLGGIIEVIALGLPPGLGSHVHWDRRLEARLGAAVLSVQAIKGVEFGPAFENSALHGTKVHDAIRLTGQQLTRPTNRAGGLEGGITNGMPLIVRAAMKPIATTLTPQETVDLATESEALTHYERSDFCPVPRAVPIIEAMVALVLADALTEKLGGDSLKEMQPRYSKLVRANSTDIGIERKVHEFWPDTKLNLNNDEG